MTPSPGDMTLRSSASSFLVLHAVCMTLSLACADMLLQSHEDQGGALLMPSAHGSNNYSSEMRSILPGIFLHLRYYELLGQQNVLLRARRYLVLYHQD